MRESWVCNNSSFVEREIFVEFVVFIAVQYVDEDHARLRRTWRRDATHERHDPRGPPEPARGRSFLKKITHGAMAHGQKTEHGQTSEGV